MEPKLGEVLFEFHRIGNTVKVAAIDPLTNTEVSIVGSAAAGEHALKMAAVRKLQYVLARRANGDPAQMKGHTVKGMALLIPKFELS